MDKLKPCPFCGGEAVFVENDETRAYEYHVHCERR